MGCDENEMTPSVVIGVTGYWNLSQDGNDLLGFRII